MMYLIVAVVFHVGYVWLHLHLHLQHVSWWSGKSSGWLKGILFESQPNKTQTAIPRCSMYGIFTYIYHKNQLNVGKYTIHGSFGIYYYRWGETSAFKYLLIGSPQQIVEMIQIWLIFLSEKLRFSQLKIDGWFRWVSFSFWFRPIFRCENVSFWECFICFIK